MPLSLLRRASEWGTGDRVLLGRREGGWWSARTIEVVPALPALLSLLRGASGWGEAGRWSMALERLDHTENAVVVPARLVLFRYCVG